MPTTQHIHIHIHIHVLGSQTISTDFVTADLRHMLSCTITCFIKLLYSIFKSDVSEQHRNTQVFFISPIQISKNVWLSLQLKIINPLKSKNWKKLISMTAYDIEVNFENGHWNSYVFVTVCVTTVRLVAYSNYYIYWTETSWAWKISFPCYGETL